MIISTLSPTIAGIFQRVLEWCTIFLLSSAQFIVVVDVACFIWYLTTLSNKQHHSSKVSSTCATTHVQSSAHKRTLFFDTYMQNISSCCHVCVFFIVFVHVLFFIRYTHHSGKTYLSLHLHAVNRRHYMFRK